MAHYTIDINVNDEDYDKQGRIKADRVFHFFQDASEAQVNYLGIGPDDLIKRDYIWVLTKMRVRFPGEMHPGRRYVCTTFPAGQKRATFKRDYYINEVPEDVEDLTLNADGTVSCKTWQPDPDKAVVIGASQWCILNYKTRALEKTDIVFDPPEDEINMIEGVLPKIHGNDPQYLCDYVVNARDLDYNDHCNNTRYIALAEEATGISIKDELYVNFASEARFGDTFKLFSEEHEEGTYVEGQTEAGERVFQIIMR